MGCGQPNSIHNAALTKLGTSQSVVKVLTLNYCGVLKSPYEFYSGSFLTLLNVLSQTFKQLLPRYAQANEKGEFEWSFSQIDKRVGAQRYSPVYNLKVGIQENKFMSKKRFIEVWEQQYAKAIEKIHFPHTEAQKLQALQFDLLTFHTLLQNVYNIKQIDEALSLDPKLYLSKYGPLFQQSFLNEQKKSVELALKIGAYDFDILFLQQTSEGLIDNLSKIDKFHIQVSKDRNTLILINKIKFSSWGSATDLTSQLRQEQRNGLNWNGHTSVALADKYILLNCHLSSKKKVNQQNMDAMKQSLKMLKQKFSRYEIICGGDANNPVTPFNSQFNIFPDSESQYTSLKKRSYLQTQFSKSDKVVKAAKDHVISTLRVLRGQIVTIQGNETSEATFLPSNQHPYDHFLVKVELLKKEIS